MFFFKSFIKSQTTFQHLMICFKYISKNVDVPQNQINSL